MARIPLPVPETMNAAQRKVYDAVLAAQEAGLAAARPGNRFKDIHQAAITVIAQHLPQRSGYLREPGLRPLLACVRPRRDA